MRANAGILPAALRQMPPGRRRYGRQDAGAPIVFIGDSNEKADPWGSALAQRKR